MTEVGPLLPADRPAWQDLFTAYNGFYGRTMTPAFYDRAWDAFAADRSVHALGARVDRRLVGIAHFLRHPSTTTRDVCYLQDLFTAPGARGRGVATALVAAVARWAGARGCENLYWRTRASNTTARRLYDRLAGEATMVVYRMPL